MPKKINTTTTLLIVESPAKCKKIEEYLGPGYKCVASYGHLRTIPSIQNIDVKNNFKPTYAVINETIKQKQIQLLKKEIKNADQVILASDSDREGEMISFSLIEMFNLPLDTKRITFNEITEPALRSAIQNPRTIDMDLVYAQQARQILDILVGFNVSPVLWKLVAAPKGKDNSLSAGRCQTPALRLVYENQKEIDKYVEQKVYNTTGYFTNLNLPFILNKQIENEEMMINFLDESSDFSHVYSCSQPIKIFKNPPEPFTTSKIQQTASNELHYSPKETMRICQQLYESGYITYMRTDSKIYSADFIDLASEYITRIYDAKYFNALLQCSSHDTNTNNNKQKNKKNAFCQEAHEAIRPTNIYLCELPQDITDNKKQKMYKLIWKNTLESCMVPASYFSVVANISAPLDMKYTYNCESIDFAGWKIVDNKLARDVKEYNYLQTIKKSSIIPYKKITSKVLLKGNKLHYTEAKLVSLLEEKGIGRPSTFSSIVDKIQERGYVKKEDLKGKEITCKDFELDDGEIFKIESVREFGNEKNKLVIQPLGTIVIEFLCNHFNSLFNYNYTELMEKSLDKIAKGQMGWCDVCSSCNKEVNQLIDKVKNETKIEFKIDDNNTFMIGKYGPVIKCVQEKNGKQEITFKSTKKNIDILKLEKGEYELNEIINNDKTPNSKIILGKYKENELVLRKGKYGLYVMWGENTRNLKELGNRPIENITFQEVINVLENGSNVIRDINKFVSLRKGPKGDYLFYKTSKMNKPKFYDIKGFVNDTNENYKTCNLSTLKQWIEQKYNINF